jgi:hypothetical protein
VAGGKGVTGHPSFRYLFNSLLRKRNGSYRLIFYKLWRHLSPARQVMWRWISKSALLWLHGESVAEHGACRPAHRRQQQGQNESNGMKPSTSVVTGSRNTVQNDLRPTIGK